MHSEGGTVNRVMDTIPNIYILVLVVKNPPANAGDTRDEGLILGQEDPLEKGMATHSRNSREFLWAEEPDRLQSVRSQRAEHD